MLMISDLMSLLVLLITELLFYSIEQEPDFGLLGDQFS